MAGQYILDTQRPDNELLLRIVPPLAAVVLLVTFVSLGLWQLDRAAEKEGLATMFSTEAPYRRADSNETPAPFERIEIRGRFLDEQQILIDNIVRTSRLGFFVITPLELSPNEPLLLVNRGWVEKRRDTGEISADLSLSSERLKSSRTFVSKLSSFPTCFDRARWISSRCSRADSSDVLSSPACWS